MIITRGDDEVGQTWSHFSFRSQNYHKSGQRILEGARSPHKKKEINLYLASWNLDDDDEQKIYLSFSNWGWIWPDFKFHVCHLICFWEFFNFVTNVWGELLSSLANFFWSGEFTFLEFSSFSNLVLHPHIPLDFMHHKTGMKISISANFPTGLKGGISRTDACKILV